MTDGIDWWSLIAYSNVAGVLSGPLANVSVALRGTPFPAWTPHSEMPRVASVGSAWASGLESTRGDILYSLRAGDERAVPRTHQCAMPPLGAIASHVTFSASLDVASGRFHAKLCAYIEYWRVCASHGRARHTAVALDNRQFQFDSCSQESNVGDSSHGQLRMYTSTVVTFHEHVNQCHVASPPARSRQDPTPRALYFIASELLANSR